MKDLIEKYNGNLCPGDYLIPMNDYQYSLEIVMVSDKDWNGKLFPENEYRLWCKRLDIDEQRLPVNKHADYPHIIEVKKISGCFVKKMPFYDWMEAVQFKVLTTNQLALF